MKTKRGNWLMSIFPGSRLSIWEEPGEINWHPLLEPPLPKTVHLIGIDIRIGITAIIGMEFTMSAVSQTPSAPGCRLPCRAVLPAQAPAVGVGEEARAVVAAEVEVEVGD